MKKVNITILIMLFVYGITQAQQTFTLTFTAIDSALYTQLDSIKIINKSKSCDTVLFGYDTILVLNYTVGLQELSKDRKSFKLNCLPNPVIRNSIIEVSTPEKGELNLILANINGLKLFNIRKELDAGVHRFLFTPGNSSAYFITGYLNNTKQSLKIINLSPEKDRICDITYNGKFQSVNSIKFMKQTRGFEFELGDELLYIGYIDTLESGILDTPDGNFLYTFQFAYNIPCPGMTTVEYEGQVYNTVQIFSQCWFKENLNVGTRIDGSEEMSDNGTIEKYCYDDDKNNCDTYGGLYQWDEMMQYTTTIGAKGICPDGWHVPSDEEWKILEGTVDTHYGVGDTEWDDYGYRGFDAGKRLKSTTGWYINSGTDAFGFTAIPGGYRYSNGSFANLGYTGSWWSSAEGSSLSAWSRYVTYPDDDVGRYDDNEERGLSVRCLKD